MTDFLNLGWGEFIIIVVTLTVIITTLRLASTAKPLPVNWLIFIIVLPPIGSIFYLLNYLFQRYFIRKK